MGLSLLAFAVGTAGSLIQGQKAASNQKKASQKSQQIQDIKASRERRKQAQQARIARANIVSRGQAVGAGGSSGVTSGAGIIGSQAGSNVSFLNQVQDLSNQASIFSQRASNAQSAGNVFGAVGSIGGNVFQMEGGFKSLFADKPLGSGLNKDGTANI